MAQTCRWNTGFDLHGTDLASMFHQLRLTRGVRHLQTIVSVKPLQERGLDQPVRSLQTETGLLDKEGMSLVLYS
jgi:hypothetical protein